MRSILPTLRTLTVALLGLGLLLFISWGIYAFFFKPQHSMITEAPETELFADCEPSDTSSTPQSQSTQDQPTAHITPLLNSENLDNTDGHWPITSPTPNPCIYFELLNSNYKKMAQRNKEVNRFNTRDAMSTAVAREEIMPLLAIRSEIESQFGYNIIGIEIEQEDGLWVYEFKLISNKGHLMEVYADARDGNVIKIENE